MKKTIIGIMVAGMMFAGCSAEEAEVRSVEESSSEVSAAVSSSVSTEVSEVPEEEISDAARLGVTEIELEEIERVMKVAGWDFDREDFERVYRLKDEEMTLNPEMFAEYEVTVTGGQTHSLMLKRGLIE